MDSQSKEAPVPVRSARLRLGIFMLLVACSVGLLAMSIYRAATYPLTHDECLSFAIFNWDPGQRDTANNHLLNTWLMWMCRNLFGDSELSLRLPTILAQAAYLACGLFMLRRLKLIAIQIGGFAMLNLNPFQLDFFFLARGYGLAMAFMLLSLCMLLLARSKKEQPGFMKYIWLSAAAGGLAVLANYTFLNFFLPLLPACLWLMLSDASMRRFNISRFQPAIALLVSGGVLVALTLREVFRLQRQGELYFGGNNGFMADTVASLVRCSQYEVPYSETAILIAIGVIVGLFVLMAVINVSMVFSNKEIPFCSAVFLILALAVALPPLQHYLLGSLLPIERGGLYYLPLFAVAMVFSLDSVTLHSARPSAGLICSGLAAVIAAILVWHFCIGFNPSYCLTYGHDGRNKEVLEIINRDRERNFPGQIVKLGLSWSMEPSMNYYRITRKYDWLAPVTRTSMGRYDNNYIYIFERDVKNLPPIIHCSRLAYFPDSRTVLLRVDVVRW